MAWRTSESMFEPSLLADPSTPSPTLTPAAMYFLTGAIPEVGQQLIKFHGSYMQDNRDRREERERKKLEWAYSYMIRLRIPGGDLTADQWVTLQDCCNENASGDIKITTRQTIQFHGVVKARMKPTMKERSCLAATSSETENASHSETKFRRVAQAMVISWSWPLHTRPTHQSPQGPPSRWTPP